MKTSNPLLKKLKNYVANDTLSIFILLLILLYMFTVPRFATPGNLMNVLTQISINAFISCGMTFVILSGGIDLSVGSVAALASIAGAALIKCFPDANLFLSIVVILGVAIVVGGICGSINGFFISKMRVSPFIVTLAMMNVARGLAYVFTDAKPIFGLPSSFSFIGIGRIGPVPVVVILMIIAIAISYVILSKTCFGRYVYAIGSNNEVAKLCGINANRVRFYVYVLCGILSALAGVIMASKLQNGQATIAMGYELMAIAAVAMGGTSMAGGRGGMIQTIFGLIVIGVINNSLSLLGVSSYWQTVAMGAIIVLAVVMDKNRKEV